MQICNLFRVSFFYMLHVASGKLLTTCEFRIVYMKLCSGLCLSPLAQIKQDLFPTAHGGSLFLIHMHALTYCPTNIEFWGLTIGLKNWFKILG